MGLMYIFPVTDDANEGDRASVKNQTLILKTYGLPMIFWGYLAAALSVIVIMWLASRAVVLKLLSYTEDSSMIFLGHLVQGTLLVLPVALLCFFFYEKMISKKGTTMTLSYRLFFMTIWRRSFTLASSDSLFVDHFMASPNMVKIRNKQGLGNPESMKHFENKGYFELNINTDKGHSVNIDRHSRKADLVKLKELLSKY